MSKPKKMTIEYYEMLAENLDHCDLQRAFMMLAEAYLKDKKTIDTYIERKNQSYEQT